MLPVPISILDLLNGNYTESDLMLLEEVRKILNQMQYLS
jgi:hypothetical protein